MTDDAFRPTGHPVRRFTLAIAVLAAATAALWWSGAVAPRLGVRPESGTWDLATRSGTGTLQVRNRGRLPVQVVAVAGDADVTVTDVTPVRIDGGRTERVTVDFRFPCPGWSPPDGTHELRIEVRTTSGLTRTVTARTDLPGAHPCPIGEG